MKKETQWKAFQNKGNSRAYSKQNQKVWDNGYEIQKQAWKI